MNFLSGSCLYVNSGLYFVMRISIIFNLISGYTFKLYRSVTLSSILDSEDTIIP